MKKILAFLLVFCLAISFGIMAFADDEEETEPVVEETEPVAVAHRVHIEWFYDGIFGAGDEPALIGATSFDAYEGTWVDTTELWANPAGASFDHYMSATPVIRYNGMACLYVLKYATGGEGVDPITGEVIGIPFTFNEYDGGFTMPRTDVTIQFYYASFVEQPEIPEDSLDKIVIYVNRPNGDINPTKQEYRAYEILHVGKAPTVEEDVTNDYTVGKDIMPDDIGFAYWISTDDAWFDVVNEMTDYFVLTETTTPGCYVVELNPNMPSNEDTAKAIAKYLEAHIPNGAPVKVVTADTPSYDNDPGYYLIISDINSNLILGTTNIAITEKAEYPTIVKTVAAADENAGIGETVTFTATVHFPEGAKAETFLTDTMTDGLTFQNITSVSPEVVYNLTENTDTEGNTINGFLITIAADTVKALAANGAVDVTFTYTALVNERAKIVVRDDTSNTDANVNTIRLDFSHFSQSSTVDIDVTSFTLLKYDGRDTDKKPLNGATFQLLDADKNVIKLTEIEKGKEYRVAMDTDDASVIVEEFTTANSEILIKGIDADLTYYLREIKAPAGYNLPSADVELTGITTDLQYRTEIANNSGVELPSTGGIGTTIFYTIGGILVVAAGIFLVAKRRMNEEEN